MFKKSTFERRMQSYMAITILIGAFLTLWTGFMWMKNNPTITIQPIILVEEVVYLEQIDGDDINHFEPVEFIILTVNFRTAEEVKADEVEASHDDNLVEYTQDNGYDGKVVIATAKEVITMQVDEDGVKHFTNHLLMVG